MKHLPTHPSDQPPISPIITPCYPTRLIHPLVQHVAIIKARSIDGGVRRQSPLLSTYPTMVTRYRFITHPHSPPFNIPRLFSTNTNHPLPLLLSFLTLLIAWRTTRGRNTNAHEFLLLPFALLFYAPLNDHSPLLKLLPLLEETALSRKRKPFRKVRARERPVTLDISKRLSLFYYNRTLPESRYERNCSLTSR